MTGLHRFGRFARFATLLWILSLAAPVAQATPTIIQGHYEEGVTLVCPNAQACSIVFTAIPAGKALIVSNVSCSITAGNTSAILTLLLTRQGSAANQAYLNLGTAVTFSSIRRFVSNTDIEKIYAGGAIPKISASLNAVQASVNMACYIAGVLITQ
jgi:hypothetical protein